MDDGVGGFDRIRQYKTYLQEEKDMRDLVTSPTEIEVSFFLDIATVVWDYILDLNATSDAYPSYSCSNRTAAAAAAANASLVPLTDFMTDPARPLIGSYGEYRPVAADAAVPTFFQDIVVKLVQIEYVKESRILKLVRLPYPVRFGDPH